MRVTAARCPSGRQVSVNHSLPGCLCLPAFMIISFRLNIYTFLWVCLSTWMSHPHLINWPPPFLYFPVHCSASATLWGLQHPVMIHAPVPSSFIAALAVNSTLSCRIVFVCCLAPCMSADIGGCSYYHPSARDHIVCGHCCVTFAVLSACLAQQGRVFRTVCVSSALLYVVYVYKLCIFIHICDAFHVLYGTSQVTNICTIQMCLFPVWWKVMTQSITWLGEIAIKLTGSII